MNNKKSTKSSTKNASSEKVSKNFFVFAILSIVFITVAVYYKSLSNQLPVWDDIGYITANPDIGILKDQSLTEALKNTFTGYVMGNYHPFTMLSYSIEYKLFGLSSKPYHVTNLVLHILNSLLVFGFIWLLTKQKGLSLITAVLFAIHPMHVESVAWVSARKDVLYSFFYLGSLCTYILYISKEKNKTGFYILTFLFFILSILSKGMAVSLPVLLFVIDYFLDRKITSKTLLEKIPFLFISLVFGLLAIQAQKSGNAINLNYPFVERVLLGFYGLLIYLWKFILPTDLSAFYAYPEKKEGGFPILVYLAPMIIIGVGVFISRSLKYRKELLFGFGFFIVSLILVLQIIPVGDVIVADRYTYLPYIGLSFIVAYFMNKQIEEGMLKQNFVKPVSIALLSVVVLMFSYLSNKRSKDWKNNIALWTAAIESDANCFVCYKSRADAYADTDQHEKAIEDYDRAVTLKNNDANVYYNRAASHKKINNYEQALNDYNMALQYDPEFLDAYFNRGNLNKTVRNYEAAITDYSLIIQKDPHFIKAYFNRAMVSDLLKRYTDAINDYTFVIHANKELITDSYCNRGNAYLMIKNYDRAIDDYTRAINTKADFSTAYFNRGLAYYNRNNLNLALMDFTKAKTLGYAVDDKLIQEIQAKR